MRSWDSFYRHVEQKWKNKDGVQEIFVEEVASFNAKHKFITGDILIK